MKCQKCNSERVLEFNAKCSDRFSCFIGNNEHNDYPPEDIGLGGGDYIKGKLCLDCGQLQGKWPLPISELEQQTEETNNDEFEEEDESLVEWVVIDTMSGRYMKDWKVWTRRGDVSSAKIMSNKHKLEWEKENYLKELGKEVVFVRLDKQ